MSVSVSNGPGNRLRLLRDLNLSVGVGFVYPSVRARDGLMARFFELNDGQVNGSTYVAVSHCTVIFSSVPTCHSSMFRLVCHVRKSRAEDDVWVQTLICLCWPDLYPLLLCCRNKNA